MPAAIAPDRALLDRCLSGDGAAWEALVRQHAPRVYNLCLRFTGRPQDAEDLAQEVFIRLHRNLASYRPEAGSFAAWLTALTRNLLIDHYRRSRQDRLTSSADDPEIVDAEPTAAAAEADRLLWNRELHDMVQRALLRLSPELREAVILRDLQDMDYHAIAAALGVPEGTVKSRINRGRLELARLLRPNIAALPEFRP